MKKSTVISLLSLLCYSVHDNVQSYMALRQSQIMIQIQADHLKIAFIYEFRRFVRIKKCWAIIVENEKRP